jgi:hypothetical protein
MLAAIALAVPPGNAHAFFINEDSFYHHDCSAFVIEAESYFRFFNEYRGASEDIGSLNKGSGLACSIYSVSSRRSGVAAL